MKEKRMAPISNTQLDKAGKVLAKPGTADDSAQLSAELVLDDWRRDHLQPLTEISVKLQEWLNEFGKDYYLAQRLKRKPQIIRKLQRFSIRLSQLQDIAGCRIIFANNAYVDEFLQFIELKTKKSRYFSVVRTTDYREKGRDLTGYRAVHVILEREGMKTELQLRSNIQHYWCESIERTSVIYGKHLKESEGDLLVIRYFKLTSDAFHTLEHGLKPADEEVDEIDRLKVHAEEAIKQADSRNIFSSRVNSDFIRGMISRESMTKAPFNNWMVVFNWKEGRFMSWELTERNPAKAIKKYSEAEKQWPSEQGFEVVMIGSSNVATVQNTHSHYFGIDSYDSILESLDDAEVAFARRNQIDSGSRLILKKLSRYNHWNQNRVGIDTVKNHYCKEVHNFDKALDELLNRGFVLQDKKNGPVALNTKQKSEMMKYI